MVIQQRDKRLLASLHRYGILSSAQIQKSVFKNIHHSAVMRRLRKLEEKNYIIRVKGLPLNQAGWSLSELGAKEIGESGCLKYQNQNTTLHEVLLSEVRLGLESLGLGSDFVTEASLKRQEEGTRHYRAKTQNNIPDGIFVAEVSGRMSVVAVELELHAKNHARYEKVLSDYAGKTAIGYVWYLAGSQDVVNAVSKVWQSIPKRSDSPALLLSYTTELFREPASAVISSAERGSIRVLDFFKCVPAPPANNAPPRETGRESACLSPSHVGLDQTGQPNL